jgi:hypothetical protein
MWNMSLCAYSLKRFIIITYHLIYYICWFHNYNNLRVTYYNITVFFSSFWLKDRKLSTSYYKK